MLNLSNVDATRRVYVGYPRRELVRRVLTSGNLSALRAARVKPDPLLS